MTILKTAVITLAALAAAAQVYGAEPSTKNRSAELRAAREKLAWDASTTKGTPRQLLLMEEQRLQGLIDDLEQGRSVDPAEIDRTLRRAR